MATSTALRRAALLAVAALVLGPAGPARGTGPTGCRSWTPTSSNSSALQVACPTRPSRRSRRTSPNQSYEAGSTADLEITDRAADISLQVLRAGMNAARISANDVITGKPVTAVRAIGALNGRRTVPVRLSSTGRAASTSSPDRAGRPRDSPRSCCVRGSSAGTTSRSCCRRRRGRRTTSATATATACPTHGSRRATLRRSSARTESRRPAALQLLRSPVPGVGQPHGASGGLPVRRRPERHRRRNLHRPTS